MENVRVQILDGVLEVTLDRPDRKNALTSDMYVALTEAFHRAQVDDAVRCLLLTATGDSFCAGNDIGEFIARKDAGPGQATYFIRELACFEKPIVAAVQGAAIGLGTTMLLHCDVVLTSESTVLRTPFVDLGLSPEAASSVLMPQRLGYGRAFAMFALGEKVSGPKAVDLGLAWRCVADSELLSNAKKVARDLANKPLQALMDAKRLMRNRSDLLQVLGNEFVIFERRLRSAEAAEALAAFTEKRPPNFRDLPPAI